MLRVVTGEKDKVYEIFNKYKKECTKDLKMTMEDILLNRMKEYKEVMIAFQKFFGEDDLTLQLAHKADIHSVA